MKNLEESTEEEYRKKIVDYLKVLVLPDDQAKARKVKAKVAICDGVR